MEIGVTDWTGARLNVAIAEQLIERRLGYPVEQVEVIDNGRMLDDLARGELDAVLEIWPSALEQSAREVLASDRVADLGPLGVVGKIGWYVPRYVIDQDPAVADWRTLADPAVASRFATPETGSRGRFLGTDPGYEQYDEEIIAALGLPFDVLFSGSEAATEAELARSVEAGEPVLLFWWTPTALIAKYDLVNIELPPVTDECLAEVRSGEPRSCDYPDDTLVKAGSPALEADEPALHRFLTRFELTTEDQLGMIDQVENGGRPIDAVAADWIAANQDRWEAWLS